MNVPRKLEKIIEFSTLDSECAYLKEKKARMSYKAIKNCSFELNSELVARGWRRFGHYFSRPQCKDCKECLSLRINAFAYEFSKSAKRCFKKNQNTKIYIQKPTVTDEHLQVYHKYHSKMQEKKGWKYRPLAPVEYYELYISGYENFGHEILYFSENKLIGVDLIDFTNDGISSIYFFYDPDFDKLSLGRFSLYQQILLAKSNFLPWIYLGYYVKDCPSLAYKDSYKPYEILKNEPDLSQKPIWKG